MKDQERLDRIDELGEQKDNLTAGLEEDGSESKLAPDKKAD